MVFANETARGDAPNAGGGEPRLEAPQPASARIGISAVAPVHLWTAVCKMAPSRRPTSRTRTILTGTGAAPQKNWVAR